MDIRRFIYKVLPILAACLLFCMACPSLMAAPKTPQKYYEQVLDAFEENRWREGKSILDEGMEKYDNDPDLYYLAGRYWWHARNYDRARYNLVKSVTLDSDQVDARELLARVEEATGNFSSAICYINELLETRPYDKELWLWKISLYRRQGNTVEANSRLRRLSQIYPDDERVSYEYFNLLAEAYEDARKNGDIRAQEEALGEMVRLNPHDLDYQMAYINLLLSQGRAEDALVAVRDAMMQNPGNVTLLRKKTDILMGSGRQVEALDEIRLAKKTDRTGEVGRLYANILAETARLQNEADPYRLYAEIYAKNPDNLEALNYLVKNSAALGYYDDQDYYLREAMKHYGRSPKYLLALYTNYRRQGFDYEAKRTLDEASEEFPLDYDISSEFARVHLEDATEYMRNEDYIDAIPMLEEVLRRAKDSETRYAAASRLYTCLSETKSYSRAGAILSRIADMPGADMTRVNYLHAQLLSDQGRTADGLGELEDEWASAGSDADREYYSNVYAEMALPYIKERIAEEDYNNARKVSGTLLRMQPKNYPALLYAVNSSAAAGDTAAVRRYVEEGRRYYPDDLVFLTRDAGMMSGRGDKEHALSLLQGVMPDYPGNTTLTHSFSGISSEYALQLMNEKKNDKALAVLDTALRYDPTNRDLLYTKGIAYEAVHQYDSAFVLQKNYQPSIMEAPDFRRHLNYLKSRSFKNMVAAGAHRYRFGDSSSIFMVANLEYARHEKNNTFGAKVNYTARDLDPWLEGHNPNGRGIQGILSWTHEMKDFTLDLEGGMGWHYFPKYYGAAYLTYTTPHQWGITFGGYYRRLLDDSDMFSLRLGASRSFERFYMSARADGGYMSDILFFNAAGTFRVYPFDGESRSYIGISAGGGTAPEMDVVNYYYMPDAFDHWNTFVSIGGSIMVTPQIVIGVDASWNTLYADNQVLTSDYVTTAVKYKNLFDINLNVTFYF